MEENRTRAVFHLPGLFEFYEFYKAFLKLFYSHREYFYDYVELGSIYGSPRDTIWSGGRIEFNEASPEEVLSMVNSYNISCRLTFSNSLLREEHLTDKKCNDLCKLFSSGNVKNGVIVHSDMLSEYIRSNYPELYLVSSTTKVITKFEGLLDEVNREEFKYVVPDFRLNKAFEDLQKMTSYQKDKLEFLCNECCSFGCPDRKKCYEDVSRKVLGIEAPDHHCASDILNEGYRFSKAMTNKGFISREDIEKVYLKMGFSNFKIEGRSLGSALILEFILYYLTKPECQLLVREELYLDNTLDLF